MASKHYDVTAMRYVLSMQGDRPEDNEDMSEPEIIYSGESYEEAKAAFEEAKRSRWYKASHGSQRDGGIGYIEHWGIDLESYEDTEDGFGEIETVESFDTMPDELKKAWDKAVRGYWGWLDYESDGYLSLQSVLDIED